MKQTGQDWDKDHFMKHTDTKRSRDEDHNMKRTVQCRADGGGWYSFEAIQEMTCTIDLDSRFIKHNQ